MANIASNVEQFIEDVAAADTSEGYMNLDNPNNANFKLPSVEEVWKLIEQMEGLSDEDRVNLRENLYKPRSGTFKGFDQPQLIHTTWDYIIFWAMMALILLCFALFGYKLYKSLKAKELKRQEKLKQKQSKKIKKAN